MFGLGTLIPLAVGGVILGSVAYPVVSDKLQDDDYGSNFADAAGAVTEKAGALGDGVSALVPSMGVADYEGDPEITDAINTIALIDVGVIPDSAKARIVAVEELGNAWSPRYEQTKTEFERYEQRLEYANKKAEEYFRKQGELTQQIRNPEDRAVAEAADREEAELYVEWRAQALDIYAQTQEVMQDIDDLNILITKQRMRTDFAITYLSLQRIPPAIEQMHSDLDEFRRMHDDIEDAVGVITDDEDNTQ